MLQKILVGVVAAVASFAVHAYGEGGGNDSGAAEAFLATKSIAPAALKAARANMFAGAINTILANNAIADLPICTGDEKWFSPQCIAKPAPRDATTPSTAPGVRHALLIANNTYRAPIPTLVTPGRDVEKLAALLKTRFGYETTVVTNPSKKAMIAAFQKLSTQAGPADSVLVFYAGHGYFVDAIGRGYWIPVDASPHTAAGWISNSDISKLLANVPARQLMVISDSCYSGSLTDEQRLVNESALAPDQILRQRTVVALSSGGNEPVADDGKDGHSIFAWNLLKELSAATDLEKGVRVWQRVRAGVVKDYPQEPQYGALMSAGHVAGGDFLMSSRP